MGTVGELTSGKVIILLTILAISMSVVATWNVILGTQTAGAQITVPPTGQVVKNMSLNKNVQDFTQIEDAPSSSETG